MNGLGQGLIPIVGYAYGARNYDRVRSALRTALPVAVGIALAATAVFLLLPGQLLALFSPSPEMLTLGVPAMRIISVTFVLASVTMVLGYAMSGLGNGVVNMLGTALRQLVVFVPLAYLFAARFGVGKVWYAMWVSEAAALVCTALASGAVLRKRGISA
jgi:Na+-driven multidrug efflux pump